ncbi:aldehyde dehydrogenase family protein, partial [Azospirillum sp. B506]|uniref:aldehyde dehydrogenase family protein n=1 Tax=Azospirillum sp. B506 TaxID=137721 RepID=UPI0005B27C9E
MVDTTRFYIDGQWVQPQGSRLIDVIDPATEEPVAQVALGTATDVDLAVAAARKAFESFSRTTPAERIDLLSAILAAY